MRTVVPIAPKLVGEADRTGRRICTALSVLVGAQLAAGLLNVVLLAPIWMQMAHLLVADLVWITFIVFSAQVLRVRRA